jgi:hypothetical protein
MERLAVAGWGWGAIPTPHTLISYFLLCLSVYSSSSAMMLRSSLSCASTAHARRSSVACRFDRRKKGAGGAKLGSEEDRSLDEARSWTPPAPSAPGTTPAPAAPGPSASSGELLQAGAERGQPLEPGVVREYKAYGLRVIETNDNFRGPEDEADFWESEDFTVGMHAGLHGAMCQLACMRQRRTC